MIILAALGMISLLIPSLLKKMRTEQRRLLLASQLHQALENMVHALRTGLGLQQALEAAAREGDQPLAGEWQSLLKSVRLGAPWPEALDQLGKRVDLAEMKWFVTAVGITRQTGGPLTQVLETLADTLEERLVLREKIKALTAQGKASGAVLAALPFLILGALRLLVPELVRPMFMTATGQLLVAGVIVSVAVGGLIMWKIVHIRVES